MDEHGDGDRDGVMGFNTGMRSQRHDLGMLAALIAVLLVPMAAPAAAAVPEQPAATAVQSGTLLASAVDAEVPSDAALRTSGTLAAIALGAVTLVGLWWYLVVRRRRD